MAFLGVRSSDDEYNAWQQYALRRAPSLSEYVRNLLNTETARNNTAPYAPCPSFDPFGPECVYRKRCHDQGICLLADRERTLDA